MARKPYHRPSSIDRLLPDIQELIAQLRRKGRTIDEIRAKLLELDIDVSRSALGRHVRTLGEVQERMRQSRAIADALVSKFGDEPDTKLGRANIELMQSIVMQTMTAIDIDEETGEAKAVTFSAEDVMFLSRSLQSLASAAKTDVDRIERLEKRAAEKATKEAAEKATKAARSKGLSKDTVEAIRFAVLGSDS